MRLINRIKYHPKSRVILSLSLMLSLFLLFIINSSAADDYQYVCIVDAGSTGSRIHVYKFQQSSNGGQLITVDVKGEKYEKFYPGLSSFEDKPSDLNAMAAYFEPILNFGRTHVPAAKRQQTAFFVLASAGMRKVRDRSAQIAQRVMDTAFAHLQASEFIVLRDGVKIIEGRNEGLWGWMAANYLNGELGKLLELGTESSNAVYKRQTTKGIVEMGGESMQITFIPREKALETLRVQHKGQGGEEHIETVKIGNVKFELFTNSWMGIGMEAAQNSYDSYLVQKGLRSTSPCYNKGISRERQHGIGQSVTWSGSGNFEDCYRGLHDMISNKVKPKCSIPRAMEKHLVCTPNKVLMPSIDIDLDTETNGVQSFYYIENFFYTAKVLGLLDIHGLSFLAKLRERGMSFCGMDRATAKTKYPDADEDEIDKTCFCAAWLLAILQEGFSLGQFDNFKVIRDIEGEGNIDWALGYLVAEVPAMNLHKIGGGELMDLGVDTETGTFRWLWIAMALCIAGMCWRNRHNIRMWFYSKTGVSKSSTMSTSPRTKGNGRYKYQRVGRGV